MTSSTISDHNSMKVEMNYRKKKPGKTQTHSCTLLNMLLKWATETWKRRCQRPQEENSTLRICGLRQKQFQEGSLQQSRHTSRNNSLRPPPSKQKQETKATVSRWREIQRPEQRQTEMETTDQTVKDKTAKPAGQGGQQQRTQRRHVRGETVKWDTRRSADSSTNTSGR